MPRRILEGQVVSDKGDKTVVVRVERRFKHPLYKKFISKSRKYSVHDAKNEHGVGDIVLIEECAPISKTKRFQVIALKEKARLPSVTLDEANENLDPLVEKKEEATEASAEETKEEKPKAKAKTKAKTSAKKETEEAKEE